MAEILDTSGATAWLTEEWTAKLAGAVEMMTDAAPGLKPGRPEYANVSEVPLALWYSIPLSLSADSAVFIGAIEDTWLHLGKSAMLAAGVTELVPADLRSAYLEMLTQATSGLAQSIAVAPGLVRASFGSRARSCIAEFWREVAMSFHRRTRNFLLRG